jgi:hypothetical protein
MADEGDLMESDSTTVLDAGEVIYREGDAADVMFWIQSGTVEVVVDAPEGERVLARFGAGDFLGDMALIGGQPRVTTARALTPVIVERISDRSFETRILGDPDHSAAYVALLMQRIRIMDALLRLEWHKQAVTEHRDEGLVTRAGYLEAVPTTENAWSDCPDLRIRSAEGTPGPFVDVLIYQIPFTLGRMILPPPPDLVPTRSLGFPDREPYQVSERHCRIIRIKDGLAVSDDSSEKGTKVNGVRIGKDFESTEAPLMVGSNTLQLGSEDSHYRFVLELAG